MRSSSFGSPYFVTPDDLALVRLQLALLLVGRVGDLRLREAGLDRRDHAAHLVDLREVAPRRLLGPVGQRLDEIRSAERIDRVRHAGLLGDDLLLPQREQGGLLARDGPCLVVRIGVEALRAAEDAGQRLDGDPGQVVERLLRGERDAGGLGVEAHPGGALVLGPEALAAQLVPDPPRGAELGDLLEEVVVAVEEEARAAARSRRSAGRASMRVLDVGDPVGDREGQLLDRGRARLADVVAADADRVPARQLARAELDRVGDEPQRRRGREDVLLLGDELLEDVVLERAGELRRAARPPSRRPRGTSPR